MDRLLECAKAFEQLLDVQYHIILGRKNQLTELPLRFDPTEFHHLVELHKLRDLRLARGNREKIFQQILSKRRERLHKRTGGLHLAQKRKDDT